MGFIPQHQVRCEKAESFSAVNFDFHHKVIQISSHRRFTGYRKYHSDRSTYLAIIDVEVPFKLHDTVRRLLVQVATQTFPLGLTSVKIRTVASLILF
jgi:hypothetical protein